MPYRRVAKWEIDMGDVRESGGWRRFFGVGQYWREIGIKFRDKEVRLIARTNNRQEQDEIQWMLPQLAHRRYQYHHRYGTGNMWNIEKFEGGLTELLEKMGVRLPGWLR